MMTAQQQPGMIPQQPVMAAQQPPQMVSSTTSSDGRSIPTYSRRLCFIKSVIYILKRFR